MEEQIANLEKTIKQLEVELDNDKLYNDVAKMKEINTNYDKKKMELGHTTAMGSTG
ncbi:MAG: ABC transporter C-terminal domain-containing protein [Micavibrio sp.]|nr:ABC transporter C-terminal domain-containing protein [Micavibrio sp.]